MLSLIKKIKLNNIAFNSFKKVLIKAVSGVTVLNITYFAFDMLFVIIFCNFKAYDIRLFIIKKTYPVIDLKVNKLFNIN